MKTQIIQLEVYDDTVSVRDKMGWGQTSRILLVWPTQGHVLERRLDLVLLQRHSLALGAHLGLVTYDSQVRANALELNIPAFANLREAQTGRWRVGRRPRPRLWRKGPRPELRSLRPVHAPEPLAHLGLRIGLFSLSLLAILALAAVLLPGASIELQVPVSAQQITIPITADQEATTVSLAGVTPAHWDSIVVEGRETITSTGTVLVPEKPATGNVQFTNLTENEVSVPAGTVVSTLDEPVIRFATIKEGTIPGGIGRKATIAIQAIAPGRAGNLDARKLQAIEGPLGLQLSAVNLSPTRGGSSLPTAGPTRQDQEKVYSSLLNGLEQSARNELLLRWQAAPLSAGFPITSTLALANTLEMVYTPEVGQPAEKLELTLRLEFKVLLVDGSDLQRLVTPLLDADLEAGQQTVPGSLTLQVTSPVELTGNEQARWQLTAERQVKRVLSQAQVAGTVIHLPAGQAAQTLSEQFKLKERPQIKLWPDWWPYLPIWSGRIVVTLK